MKMKMKELYKRPVRKLLVTILGVATVVACVYLWALADTTESRVTPFTPSQSAISAYYNQHIAAISKTTDSFAVEAVLTAPYASATLDDDTLLAAATLVNYIRFIAGLDFDVSVSREYCQLAADASLVNLINNSMSHYPSSPDGINSTLYASAYEGASNSNLSNAWSTSGSFSRSFYTKIVNGWMADETVATVSMVGHRRWILSPTMSEVGFGSAEDRSDGFRQQSAMYIADGAGAYTDMTAVIWPAANTPINLFNNNYPWSYTYGSEISGAVTVTLTNRTTGQKWVMGSSGNDATHFYIDNSYSGQPGCIIFVPTNISYSAGDIFDVLISGSIQDSYTVSFFDVTSVNADPNLSFSPATFS